MPDEMGHRQGQASDPGHLDHNTMPEAHDPTKKPDREHHTAHDSQESDGKHTQIDHTGHELLFRNRFFVTLVLSIPVLIFSPSIQNWLDYSTPGFSGNTWIVPLLSIVIFAIGGVPFLQMAVPEIRARKPGMMMLISLAIIVALIYSYATLFIDLGEGFFWELVTLIVIMLLGHWLEMRSVRQASGALDELAKLMPDTAERITAGGETEEVKTSVLTAGDLVLVRPGASIPVDGEVKDGQSDVNEALITGESRPVKKTPGDQVIGGSINGDGSLRIQVVATGDETALAGIMRLVREAQQSKSNTQLLADKAAGWLFYIAVSVAVLTAIAWTIAVGFNVAVIARVATVLVIACPHALGLAIPLVVAITTSMGAKNGILVRDRLALEKARDIDMVIFDKTGTLTKGEFGVESIAVVDDWVEDEALALAAAVEGDSEHTIAQGLRASAEERELQLPPIDGFEAIKGRGVKASSNGYTVYIGGPRMLEHLDIALPPTLANFEKESSGKGQSVVHLIRDAMVIASFALADVVRPESEASIKRLHELGVEVAMLTGDSQAVASAVAEKLGIDQFFAEVLPEHKAEKVASLQADGRRVAMVGDGVNDAPALAKADVGIAIGSGTDVAIESAGIILVKSNPLDVVKIFDLSRASYRKMIQNLVWATGYNIVAIPLAAGILAPIGILLSPAIGALFMSLSTVLVAINAQTLRQTNL